MSDWFKTRWMKITLAVMALSIVGVWVAGAIVTGDPNPAKRYTGDIISPAADDILRRACFDCHSNETVWPWYSNLPIVSLVTALDVDHGRSHLNFSEWDRMDPAKRGKKIRKALEEIREGEMPIAIYAFMHPEALITDADIEFLKSEAGRSYDLTIRDEGGDHDEEDEDDDHEH